LIEIPRSKGVWGRGQKRKGKKDGLERSLATYKRGKEQVERINGGWGSSAKAGKKKSSSGKSHLNRGRHYKATCLGRGKEKTFTRLNLRVPKLGRQQKEVGNGDWKNSEKDQS